MNKQNKIRANGIYYTTLFNPFTYKPFGEWVNRHRLTNEVVLEPFAGENSLIRMLQDVRLAKRYKSFDIHPKASDVAKLDTLKRYPTDFNLCITNPPWLYKSRAKRLGLKFPKTKYDDLYKHALEVALQHTAYVGALLPASFLQSNLFQDRLEVLICINRQLFEHTESPVCLALFSNAKTNDIVLYEDDAYIGTYNDMKKLLPQAKGSIPLSFNQPDGALGLVAIDNSKKPSIRFCKGEELSHYHIRHSSRSISRISGLRITDKVIKKLNRSLNEFRQDTHDIFLTTFKGLRADGKYRRRIEYRLAREIIGLFSHQ